MAPASLGGLEQGGMRRRRLKLVHTSDVHIEGDSLSRQERWSRRGRAETAFGQVIDAARDVEADLLLVAGDLF